MKTGREVRQRCCVPAILFNVYSEYLIKEALERFVYLKRGRQVIRTVKYADDLVLLDMEEAVLEGMTEGLIETGRCMEWK